MFGAGCIGSSAKGALGDACKLVGALSCSKCSGGVLSSLAKLEIKRCRSSYDSDLCIGCVGLIMRCIPKK